MKIASRLLLVFISFQIISCSNCKDSTKSVDQEKNKITTPPASIVQNLSIVTARVEEVLYKSETEFQLRATVLTVEQNDNRPSIAVPGNEYLFTPNFRYTDQTLIENDVNDSLKKIGKLSKGKEFKAEISLENDKGWFIQKVLEN
ncbi:MAG: hypothetical protein IT276_05735 [Ignavibacteriaceae bacterium]|nr:hypothetical protein [Ignavibacterium sp.]MCC6254393.1 hypothetical protein [Ignavibacteriaceae bacterium]HMN25250.1 hypothetical protein [Ignavibacteriaceae bacterium]HRN26977.1 hypothetical protein [Ignavibacteriaceae bacterium]HRP93810.1 hypothetical protein [Ignavibacteriaceae bacterium]